MTNSVPKPAQLGPPGSYTLSIAEEFLGTSPGQAVELIRLRFRLADATELHLRLGDVCLKQLCKELEGLCKTYFGPSANN